jgi:predicted permease
MEGCLQDLRFPMRVMRGNPVLVIVSVLSLALGIGPNAAIFSVIDALGLRPLSIEDPSGLVRVSTVGTGDASSLVPGLDGLSYPDYLDVASGMASFSSVAMSGPQAVAMRVGDAAAEIRIGAFVSAGYFRLLGVRAALGRTFLPYEDATPGTHPVVVVSDRLWKRAFSADPAVVGRAVRLNNTDFVVVGVMPVGFRGTDTVLAPELWVPSMMEATLTGGASATLTNRGRREMSVFARLKDGVSIEQARAELAAIGTRLEQAYPQTNAGRQLTANFDQQVRRRPAVVAGSLTLAVVGLVLLVACANVAGLLLGRSEVRRAEIGVRLALGATRGRLVRQLLTEAAVLALLAVGAALILAHWLVLMLPALIPEMPMTLDLDFRVDYRVLVFTFVVAVGATPLFGLVPALSASRSDLVSAIKGAPAERRYSRLPLRQAIVVGQVAAALVLLVASGLFVRSLVAARQIDPGFVVRPMVACTLAPGAAGYDQSQVRRFYDTLLQRIGATPGFERASLVRHLPLNALYGGGATQKVEVAGHEPPAGEDALRIRYNTVGAGYFETMGIRLVAGRPFSARDRNDGPIAIIVNQAMANRFWGGADAVGQHLVLVGEGVDESRRDAEIVGVARDGKYLRLSESPEPYLYIPFERRYAGEMTVIAAFSGKPADMVAAFRREIHAIDPGVPALQVVTMAEHMRLALFVERTIAVLMAVLGALGLVLSAVGLYGIIAFTVAQRTREIGVRVALGASPIHVVRDVVASGGRLALVGVLLGTLVAVPAMRLAAGLLNGVSPGDPAVFTTVGLLVIGVALLASYVPARRAARSDPSVALRAQ